MTNFKASTRLSRRLIRISFVVIFLALIALTMAFTAYTARQAHDNLSNDLRSLANVLGDQSKAALVFLDKRMAEKNMLAASYRESVKKACLFDLNGNLFADFLTEDGGRCDTSLRVESEFIDTSIEFVDIVKPIIDSEDVVGYIEIQASTVGIQKTLMSAFSVSFLIFLLVSFVAYVSLKRQINNALWPLLSLHETAETISANPLAPERAKSVENDEVGRLVHVFNKMLDTLSEDNRALQESETRFRTLAQHAPIGIYQLDEELEFIYTNPKWHELTRLNKVHNLEDFQKFVSSGEQSFHNSIAEKARYTKDVQILEYQYLLSESEGDRIFLEHMAPIFTKSGEQLKGYIGSLMDISELKSAQMELEQLAFYDPLTGLPNRRFFRDFLDYAINDCEQNQGNLALLMIDIDNFKKVNDTLGHDAGDEMLKAISARLENFVSKKDLVCRLGGDEFVVLIKDIELEQSIQTIAQRILNVVRDPLYINNHDIDTTCSIGISTYPEDGNSQSALMRNADMALYLSKDEGKNRISFFSKNLEASIREKVDLETRMKAAIKKDHFIFYVQPKLSLFNGKITSLEVLIRWQDPVDGMIWPDKFIPVAEETGLILPLGNWLIESVFKAINSNIEALETLGIESLAINLSARQFYSNTLVDSIRNMMERYDIDPTMIEFELTESSVIEDIETAIKIMEQIKSMGCKISIDDFGTGYSSLSYLKRFPIDAVKIDRSFISDIPHDKNDVEISSAIIAMGHKLGLEVIAEGVETDEQLMFLKRQRCEKAQGYYIAKPMPFDELLEIASSINSKMKKELGDSSTLTVIKR